MRRQVGSGMSYTAGSLSMSPQPYIVDLRDRTIQTPERAKVIHVRIVLLLFAIALLISLFCDSRIAILANGIAQQFWIVDRFISFLGHSELIKGGVVLAVFFFAWFGRNSAGAQVLNQEREALLYTLLVCVPGLAFTRAIALVLPYRDRPIFNPDLHLRIAAGFEPNALLKWSSFPSDHAVLFFALATSMYFAHRRCGILLYAYSSLVVLLPRLILGMHYPSDLLVGVLFGMALAGITQWQPLRRAITPSVQQLLSARPGIFYALFFLLCYETADVYGNLTSAAIGALAILKQLI